MLKFCKPLFLLLFIIFLNNFTFSQILPELEKVKEIKLLEHSREDVRKILVSYKFNKDKKADFEDTFETENAEIEVSYSNGKCEFWEKVSYDWKVAKWKVVEIMIIPKNKLGINEIGLNLSKFKKETYYFKHKEPIYYHQKDLGIIIKVIRDKIIKISLEPPKKDYMKRCDKKLAKRLLFTSSYFDPKDKNRNTIFDPNEPPKVEKLVLSLEEIYAACSINSENKTCSENVKTISISTIAKDPENDNLTYAYQVSGGKIIGNGAKVLWNLSDVKPGIYTITVDVDDGGGFTEKTITKTVTVKECSDCKKP